MPSAVNDIDGSLPSRGAWIETYLSINYEREHDRRSLRGERGLKLVLDVLASGIKIVAPFAGSVD